MIEEKIKKIVKKTIKSLREDEKLPHFQLPEIEIESPEQAVHGDYSTNVAFKASHQTEQNTLQVAQLIGDRLKKTIDRSIFDKIEVVKPGFINFFLSLDYLKENLRQIMKEKERYGSSDLGKGKTIVIDYSAPNIAKPFGVGHLRSTIIGQAVYNIFSFLGFETIGDNHLGDWGTQYGKLFYAIKKWGDEEKIEENPIMELYKLYVRFHKEAKKNPQLEEKGREWFKRLEEGDKEVKKIWEKCVQWSLEEFDDIYEMLDVEMDLTLGESFYCPFTEEIIQEALEKGVAEESQGALIIKFPDEKFPPLMIRKSDGTTLYSTRDLATIKYRREKFDPYKIVYEVGVDQELYFKQLFWAAELMGFGKREDYFHIAHGMMRLPEGKMSTRRGRTVFLERVLEEAIGRAEKIVEKKSGDLSGPQKEKIAKIVGIGAVKYNDLSRHYSKNVVFDWKQILNLKGNSGPYLQYTYTRAWSVLEKSGEELGEIGIPNIDKISEDEMELLKLLLRFPGVIRSSAESYSPNLVCNYLFDLAQKFNYFYEVCPVLKAEAKDLKELRLLITFAVAQVIKNGLSLLGIKVLKRM